MISPEINTSVKAHLIAQGYTTITLMPLLGYADSAPPFITYNEYVSTRSVEQFWLRQSTLMYYVYDNDASRAKDIGKILDSFLNVGDDVDTVNSGITGSRSYRLRWLRLLSGMLVPAVERDGFISNVRAYEIGYIEL